MIGHIDNNEIFRLSFDPQAFVENFHKVVAIPKLDEDSKNRVRGLLEQLNPEEAETITEAEIESFDFKISKIILEEKQGT